MGDSVNRVDIQITDQIAPSISPNLAAIANNAKQADSSILSLKQTLDTLSKGGGVAGLKQLLTQTTSSTNTLRNATEKMGTVASTSSQQVIKLANSYSTLNFALLATIQTLSTYATAASAASGVSRNFTTSQGAAASAVRGTADGALAARATLQVMSGSMMGASRAAGVFIANTLGLGSLLKFAFPVIGAVALLEVLGQLVAGIHKVAQEYKEMGAAAVKAEFDAIAAGDKVVKAKAEAGTFSAAGLAKLLHGDFQSYQDITIANAATKLKDLAEARKLLTASNRADEAGLQGLAAQKERAEGIKKEIALVKQQAIEVHNLANALQKQGEAMHNVSTPDYRNPKTGQVTPGHQEFVSALDPSQRKALEDQFRIATQAARDLDNEVKVLGFDLTAAEKKEPLAALKDDMKAARLQKKQFEEEFAQLKIKTKGVVTPQQEIDLFKSQRERALTPNIPAIDLKLGNAEQAGERQKLTLQEITDKLKDQRDAIGLYSNALREKQLWDKIDLQLTKDRIVLTDEQKQSIKDSIKYVVEHTEYEKELKKTYAEFNDPLRNYKAALEAINKLEKDQAITHNQALIAQNQAGKSYRDATQPLYEYSHQLENQVALLGKYGIALTVATEVQRVQDELRNQGRSLTAAELDQLTHVLTQLDRQKQLQSDVNKLYSENQGAVEKVTIAYASLLRAQAQGIISDEKAHVEMVKLKVDLANLQIQMGKATGKDVLTSVFGSYLKNFQGFTKEVTTLYTNMFSTIADGAADSLGRALVYGEDLGKALKDVARQALAELISGFIKLGIRMLIQATLGHALAGAATAAAIAEASAVAAAWAPAAAFASLATLGTNAAPADAALTSTVALAEMLSLFSGFAQGGLVPGVGDRDTVPIIAMPGEYMLRKSAVQQIGLPNLEALNHGFPIPQLEALTNMAAVTHGASSVRANGASGGSKVYVKVEHDGSTAIAVEQVSENKIRIIAQSEAKDAIEKHAPAAIAADLSNPNSKSAKSLQHNFEIRRKR